MELNLSSYPVLEILTNLIATVIPPITPITLSTDNLTKLIDVLIPPIDIPLETSTIPKLMDLSAETLTIPTSIGLPTKTLTVPTSIDLPTETLTVPTSIDLPTETLTVPTSIGLPTETLTVSTSIDIPTETLTIPTSIDLPMETLTVPTSIDLPTETLNKHMETSLETIYADNDNNNDSDSDDGFYINNAMKLLLKSFPESEYEVIPKTINELKRYILDILNNQEVEYESLSILPILININKLGLITFESQPRDLMFEAFSDGSYLSQRAYLNGLFPRHLVSKLATQLYGLNKNIVVSETVLHPDPSKDYLNLFNFSRDSTPLIHGLYPMVKCTSLDQTVQWYSGYSGNVNYPMLREYIVDHFFIVPPKLTNEIVAHYSLIQIWSKNISDDIFPIISNALSHI